MANRWIGVALVAGCLTFTGTARAQYGPEGGGGGYPGCQPPMPMIPGPMSPEQAPPGPGEDLSLPANIPNAFTSDCCECGPMLWISGEYILWWIKSPRLSNPLITTNANPPPGNNPPTGLLGQTGTIVLAGIDKLNYNPSSGGRVNFGFYLDGRQAHSIEGSAFVLQKNNVSFGAGSNGTALIGVPFFDSQNGREFLFADAIPNFRAGSATATIQNQLWGAEGNYVCRLGQCCGCIGASFIGGFRYIDLNERFDLEQRSTAQGTATVAFGAPFGPPESIAVRDTFRTRNQFYGGQVGFRAAAAWRQIFFAAQAKVALGNNREVIDISGQSSLSNPTVTAGGVTVPIPPISIPGGRFATFSNSGRFTRDEFNVVPEFEGRIGFQIHPAALFYVGYNFMYMNRVARAGDQLDRNIDLTQVPTAFEYNPALPGNNPRPLLTQTYFWAQGMDVGLEITY